MADNSTLNVRAFATRSEQRAFSMPRIPGKRIISVDMGYSGIKGFHGGGYFCFPNYCVRMMGGQFGNLEEGEMIYVDAKSGIRYFVGRSAIKSLRDDETVPEESLYGRNHYLQPEFLVTFRTALAMALWEDGNTDGSDICLQTGLPPAYLEADREYLLGVMEGHHVFSVCKGSVRRDFDLTLTRGQISVMAQPMGTFWSAVIDRNGHLTELLRTLSRSGMFILDGGFGTLDTFFVLGHEVQSKPSNPNLGMRRVFEEARRLIREETGAQISLPAMQSALERGTVIKSDRVNMSTVEIPVADYLKRANDLVMAEAFDAVKDNLFDVRYMIITGGTGEAWLEYFKKRLSGITTLKIHAGNEGTGIPSVYVNARGYYMYKYSEICNMMRRAGSADTSAYDA